MATLSRPVSNVRITLGVLINFNASVHSAVEDKENAGLSSLCTHEHTKDLPDGGDKSKEPAAKIRRRDFCPTCDNDDKTKFVKGTLSGDTAVIVSETQVEAANAHGQAIKGSLELHVHTGDSVNGTFPTGKSYYLNAKTPTDAKLYKLLAHTLGKHPDLTLMGEASLRGAAMLYQVVADGDVLIMRQLARPETIRERPVVEGEVEERLAPQLEALLLASAEPYTAEAYASQRAKVLAEALATAPTVAATSGGDTVALPSVDLEAQLAAALAALGEQATAPAAKPARKRAAAKKPAA